MYPPRLHDLSDHTVTWMNIAQVAPLYESVPPQYYGGTERVVSQLTEELVRQGHAVTLFASGDSETEASLVPICPRALRLDEDCVDALAHHVLMLERVAQQAGQFDVLHFHIDYLHFTLSRVKQWTHVTTLHGRLDLPDLEPLYHEFTDVPVVSISDAQRSPLPQAHWQETVYHGLSPTLFSYNSDPGDYLAFLGRISPEKRVDRAVEIAGRAGLPLKVAAKVDPVDREYFDTSIAPLFEADYVDFVGEIGEREKQAFLGNARALLCPIDWPEPFGLVLIEALACGTPVIAFPHGSIPELIDDGVSGFVVDTVEDAVEAVHRLPELSRRTCRQVFEDRFTAARMAQDYLRVYDGVLAQRSSIL